MSEQLYMVRLAFDLRCLSELGRARRLPTNQVDTGYLVHCALGETFGDAAPKPFHIEGQMGKSRGLSVLAYSSNDLQALRARAQMMAHPLCYQTIDWDQLAAKPLPSTWHAGCVLGFRTRVCPVVRMDRDGLRHRKGAEVDVFLASCFAPGWCNKPVDRETAYREWFAARLGSQGGARLRNLRVQGYKLDRLLRRTHGEKRQNRQFSHPEALISGELEITDGPTFAALLRRGIGRHRAFGFGMLLLRPAGSSGC